jgi:hypothetical protein
MRFVEAVKALLATPRKEPQPAPEVEPSPSQIDAAPNDEREEENMPPANVNGPSLYHLFAWAIENRARILCRYKGVPREISPVVLGHKNGKEVARVYQTGGESSGDLPDWRTFEISNVSDVRLAADGWRPGPAGHQGESPFEVDYDANPDSPFGPTRSLGDLRGTPLDYPIEQP